MAASFDIVAKLRADTTQFVKGMKSGEIASTNFVSALGGASQTIAIGTAAAVGVAAAALFKLGSSFHDAYKEIRVGTGQTGEALDQLNESFRNVYAKTPASMKDVGSVITDLNVKLGLTGPILEATALQMLKLSRITGTDLKANTEAVTTVFKQFSVKAEDQRGALDLLYRASQTSGVSVANLASQMASAGNVMRQVGFDFQSSAAFIGMLAKGGIEVRDVVPAMTRALATAGKEGKSASDLFGETFQKIRDAASPIEATGIALEVFGARGGPKLAGLIREGKLSYEEYLKSILSGTDTISKAAGDVSTFGGKLTVFGHNVQLALEPLATAIFQGLNSAMKFLMPTLEGVAKALGALAEGFLALPTPLQIVVPLIVAAALAIKGLIELKALVMLWGSAIEDALVSLGNAVGLWTEKFLVSMAVSETAAQTAGNAIALAFGPVVLALGAAFIAFSFWQASQKEGEQKAKEFTQTLDKQTGAWTANTTEIVKNRLEQDGNLKKLSDSGITLEMWRKAVVGGTGEMLSLSRQTRLFGDIAWATSAATKTNGAELVRAAEAGQRLTAAEQQVADAYTRSQAAAASAREELKGTGNAVDALLPLLAQVPGIQNSIVETLRSEAEAYQTKQDLLRSVGIAQNIATGMDSHAAEAAYDLAQANKQAAEAIKTKNDELKAAVDPLFANMRAMQDLGQAQREYAGTLMDGTKSEADRRAAYDRVVEATGAYADSLSALKVGLLNGTVSADRVRERLEVLQRLGLDPNSAAFRDLAQRVAFAAASMDGVQAPSLVAAAALAKMKADGLDPASEAARGLQQQMMDAGRIAYELNGTIIDVEFNLRSKTFWADARAIAAWLNTLSPTDRSARAASIAQDAIYGQALGSEFRASGGPVLAGSPYIVGERGPELFVPGSSGSIISNAALAAARPGTAFAPGGGGSTYNIVLNVPPTADKAAIGQATVEAIAAYERRSGSGWRS